MKYSGALSKRDLNRLERRDLILKVARDCFLQDGFSRTTMSSIAAKLGGSKGTLWKYYSSKYDLFSDFVRNEIRHVLDMQSNALSDERPIEDALKDFCVNFIERIRSPEAVSLFRVVAAESDKEPLLGRIFFESGPGQVEGALRNYLSRKFPISDPVVIEDMINFLISLCIGSGYIKSILCIYPNDKGNIDEISQIIVGRFLAIYDGRTGTVRSSPNG